MEALEFLEKFISMNSDGRYLVNSNLPLELWPNPADIAQHQVKSSRVGWSLEVQEWDGLGHDLLFRTYSLQFIMHDI